MDVLVIVVIAPQPEDVDRLRHETIHNSGRCCGSGRTCYGAGWMSKALRTSMGFGSKVGPRQAQREKGSSPTLDVNGCCCSFVWAGRCVASQVPHWPRPTFVAIEPKKNCVYQALSLSPPLEERARGEVGGSWTLIRSNHPTAIFGQRVPYPAGIQIVISS